MLWSAALFGHYKPRFYLRNRTTGELVTDFVEQPEKPFWDEEKYYLYPVEGHERRAEPGDIIAVRPIKEQDRWTDVERKLFLIVTLDDFELEQLSGLTEPYWDTASYPIVTKTAEDDLKAKGETIELRPTLYVKKRRFNVPVADLSSMGVDTGAMLDKKTIYTPKIDPIVKVAAFDKLNTRYAAVTDGFNVLAPRKIGAVTGKVA